jgi:hemolysin activation/secretion protein
MALGASGARVAGDFTYAWSEPSIPGGGLKSRTLLTGLGFSYPVVRSQARNLLLSGGFQEINQSVDFAGIALSRDRLRVFSARADFDAIDPDSVAGTNGYSPNEPKWRLAGSLELRQGIAGLGASRPCSVTGCFTGATNLSRSEGDPSAFVVRGTARIEYRPAPQISFSLAPRVQYAPHALLSYEEFSVGNYSIGRGFDPGTLQGDSGVGFSAEIGVGREVPLSANDLVIQPFAFFDAAWVWNRDTGFNGIDPLHVKSAGGGIHGAWGNHGRFDLTVAVPLEKTLGQTKRGDVRILFTITAQLAPWTRR